MPRRRMIDIRLLLASLGIALGIVLVVLGINASVTGREEQELPDAIEGIEPIRGATQVLQQGRVFVDLQPGFAAVLVLNGVELETVSLAELGDAGPLPAPGEQVSLPRTAILEPGNNTITYTPVEGGPIERFTTGLNSASVVYWPIDEDRGAARSYSWTFTVI